MRIGIIGTGQVSGWFVAACRATPGVEATAIYSRTAERGRAFADEHGLATVHTELAGLLASSAIDAVYVASPTGAHAGQVLAALAAGKHVLCEKTMGVDLAEARAMVAAARAHGRVLLEAVRPLHDPAWRVITANLDKLGRIWHARLEKCQYSSRYDDFRHGVVRNAFDPALGNSALADIGVYCVHPAVLMFGRPSRVEAVSTRLPNGFEASGAIVLAYDSLSVTCRYSKVTAGVVPSVIEGEDASMTIDAIAEPANVQIRYRDGTVEDVLVGPPQTPAATMPPEVADFAALVRAGRVEHEFTPLSLAAMQIMEAARRAAA